jgi:hypothetical protein
MTEKHTLTLQDIAADRDWWSADAGKHYRELAHWLRGIAAKCRLPYTQKELLDLARRYDTRADHIGGQEINLGVKAAPQCGSGPVVR